VANQLLEDGFTVVAGEVDDAATYESVNIDKARLLLANAEDSVNTNILLTVRSLNSQIPTIAIAEENDSLDIFSLSGATYPLPLKARLGEYLATRVSAGIGTAHEVGRFKDLVIVEFLVHDTALSGMTLRETRMREKTGLNVVGIWESGHFVPVRPDQPLADTSVPVAIGKPHQVERLNNLLGETIEEEHEVLVIGGGQVGISATLALRERGVSVRLLDLNPELEDELKQYCNSVTIGNAADRKTLEKAGIHEVSAVALTTNDDAENIHLAVYCRRLNPSLSIVSRVTRERNVEALYRAGSDFVLSYSSLGREFITAHIMDREPVMVGEGADFFSVELPPSLEGKTLPESGIGARTGLVVIAIEEGEETITNPGAKVTLNPPQRLIMLGTNEQREKFNEIYPRRIEFAEGSNTAKG
jgi:Trk K+ transport system NAD-binding subunit